MFSFLSLGMIEWEFSNLSATSNDITIESITLAHTGIERIPLSWMPGFADAVNTWKNGSDDGMDAMREIVEENNRQFKERQKKIILSFPFAAIDRWCFAKRKEGNSNSSSLKLFSDIYIEI